MGSILQKKIGLKFFASSVIFILCNELYFKGERSNYFAFLGYSIPCGEAIGVLMGYIFLDSLGYGDW